MAPLLIEPPHVVGQMNGLFEDVQTGAGVDRLATDKPSDSRPDLRILAMAMRSDAA
jgi:hypothetical protein